MAVGAVGDVAGRNSHISQQHRSAMTRDDNAVIRARLIEAAVEGFADKGIAGASTRSIAERAGTAMSSITYHFGGKLGLYLAAAAHASGLGTRDLSSAIAAAAETTEPAMARQVIRKIILALAATFAEPAANDALRFAVRENIDPSPGFGRLPNGILGPATRALVRLIDVATGGCGEPVARLTTVSLIGQVLAPETAKATFRMLFEEVDDAIVEAYVHQVIRNVEAILDRIIEDGPARAHR